MRQPGRTGSLPRRAFLAGAASAAATFTVMKPSLVRGTQANSAIRLGMIGCGGRGGWIAGLFTKTGHYQFTACADYFQDRVDAFGDKNQVAADRRYTTLSGYKKLLERDDVDAVVIETPPYFHPEQAAAAVAAGKHVYLAKPIAVDVPGCQSVADSGKKATEKNLVFLVDFQTRADDIFIEALKRVRAGDLGKLSSCQASYLWDKGVHDQPVTTPEERLRYWYNSRALCGDVIVEQDIHSLDVACWFANADPVKAFGNGGRLARKHGEIYDHFAVTYIFPENFVVNFLSQKSVPGAPDEIRCRVFGTEGYADTNYNGLVKIDGTKPFPGGTTEGLYARGAERNIADFYNFVSGGDVSNSTVAPSVRSNLTCVLGRTAAYRGTELSWDQLLRDNERLEADLSGLKA